MIKPDKPDPTNKQLLAAINAVGRKVTKLMATLESIEALLGTLTTDLEALATSAKAEFAKLEAEVAAGQPTNLEPLATIIEGIDAKVKAAVVPST